MTWKQRYRGTRKWGAAAPTFMWGFHIREDSRGIICDAVCADSRSVCDSHAHTAQIRAADIFILL